MSDNGNLLIEMIERTGLELANSSHLCSGTMTRHRVADGKVENAVLDYILICENLSQSLEMIFIDDQRHFALTKYASKKG